MKIRGQRVIPPKERIESNSIPVTETGCWLWLGGVKGHAPLRQYGNITVGSRKEGGRRTVSAHRFSYETYIGPIPEGMFVCHKCDVPSCVNPDHLFVGTRQDNVDDRERKGRNDTSGIIKRGEDHLQSKLTQVQVDHIKINIKKRGDIARLAKEFGVSYKTISDINMGKTWKLPEPPHE